MCFIHRIVREIVSKMDSSDVDRISSDALDILREGAETYAMIVFEDANAVCANRGSDTLQPADMEWAKRAQEDHQPNQM